MQPDKGNINSIVVFLGALVAIGGTLVLVGWAMDSTMLKSLVSGWVSMKANTALAFVLSGIAVLLAGLTPGRITQRISAGCAWACVLIGLLTLAEYVFAWNPGFDQWLFPEPANAVATSHPGRMAPDAALCFVLVGGALLLGCCPWRKTMIQFWVSTICGSLVMAAGLTASICYASHNLGVFGFWGMTLMAFSTALLFMMLGVAVVFISWPLGLSPWSFKGKAAMGFAAWSLIVVSSLAWGLHREGHQLMDTATAAARANINKDMAFRKWGASHGGVYVLPSQETPPNPYLEVPDRDVVTTGGKALTLMNPAYMLREMQHRFASDYGTRSRITSLKPLNPKNAPDPWQQKALASFAEGNKERLEVQQLEGQPYLRLMLPFVVEQSCLKCHAKQGYKLGDIRGGIDSSLSLVPFLAQSRQSQTALAFSHLAIWLLGTIGLAFFYRHEHGLELENQRSAEALQDSEERFRLAAQTANDLVYEWDLADRVEWSGRVDEMLGYEEGQFPRTLQGFLAALHPDDYDMVMAAVQEHLEGEVPYNVEYRIQAKDGSYRWWSARGVAVRKENGSCSRWVGTVTDITREKQAEKDKEKLEARLRQSQKMEAIGTLAGGIAHDFNNILSIIFGYSELAMGEDDPQQRQEQLAELQKGAQRAKELVAQILTFSRKGDKEMQPVQVSVILKEALKMLRSSIPTTIEFRQDIVSDGLVLADPTQIHQIIMNLCTNAYHAMRQTGGVLAVSLHDISIASGEYGYANLAPGKYMVLEVSDTGCGIAPDIVDKIFDPYFTTKPQGEGTGMGLAVVHGVVQSHHGHITAYSEPGKGTSFHVYLPLTEQKHEVIVPQAAIGELRGNGERILLVDDEDQICQIIEATLAQNNYEVVVCKNGMEAWGQFEKSPQDFALLLTDMTMPFMTGEELTEKILKVRPELPVILCTGQSELINREKALANGVCDYLSKPVIREELLVALKRALAARGISPS